MKLSSNFRPNRFTVSRWIVYAYRTRSTFIAFSILFVGLSFVQSCTADDNTPEPTACNQEGVIEPMCNGYGAWKENWIRLDNGEYLRPWSGSIPFEAITGQRIKFKATPVAEESGEYFSNPAVCCFAALPASVPVKVSCAQVAPSPTDCSVMATVMITPTECGTMEDDRGIMLVTDDNLQMIPIFTCNMPFVIADGQKIKIGYTITDSNTLPVKANVTCVSDFSITDKSR